MNAKSLMNLTPHNVDIFGDEGFIVTVQPSGTVARVAEVRESCSPVQIGTDISGFYIPVSRATYGAVQGLPDSDGETIYIVSALVLAQCAGRNDVFAPVPAIRDDAGRQIGCHGLSAAPAQPAAIDDIIDGVHEALVNRHLAGHDGYMVLPERDEAARLLRGLSAAAVLGWERAEMRERAAVEGHHA